MINIIKKNNKKESGAIFIETTMVLAVVFIVLAAMLGLGFYIYQKAMLDTVAVETANYAANNYKYTSLKSIDISKVEDSKMKDLKKYRSYRSLLDSNKIEKYAKKRGKVTSFTDDAIKVKSVKLIRDGIGRQRIKLTLEMRVNLVFENVMVGIGLIDDNPTVKSTAYAECLDITEYSSQVYFVKYIQDGIDGTNIGKSMDSIGNIISKVGSIISKLSN